MTTTREAMLLYLIEGKPVGQIATDLKVERALVRALLKDGGIIFRPSLTGYALGRDPVCDAVRRAGYSSFHDYAPIRSLDPITEQAAELSVSDKSLSRVYNAYRHLLVSLKAAGVVLPTSQIYGVELERPREDRAS